MIWLFILQQPGKEALHESSIKRAKKLKIPLLKRSEMIGRIMKGYRGISISGMHGKTTTSTLVSRILEEAGLSPSYLIGAEQQSQNPTAKLGEGIDFVSEACEYDGSFLDFPTKVAIITNIEREHLDYFKGGLPEIMRVFSEFIEKIYPGGLIVYCRDDANVTKLVERSKKELAMKKVKLISYGFNKDANARISSYKVQGGYANFKIGDDKFLSRKVGKYFALDFAAAYSVARFLGVNIEDIRSALHNFRGPSRRFEYLGEKRGIAVYDDYGHHPTEIKSTFEAFRETYPKNRRVVIYQPHQQKRFDDFYDDFLHTFKTDEIDLIVLLPVYKVPGRDEAEKKNAEQLVHELGNTSKYFFLNNYEEAVEFLRKNLRRGDVLMTMGATDVYKVAEKFLKD